MRRRSASSFLFSIGGLELSIFVPLGIVLLVIGFLTCGREFGAKTVYTSILLPAFIGLF